MTGLDLAALERQHLQAQLEPTRCRYCLELWPCPTVGLVARARALEAGLRWALDAMGNQWTGEFDEYDRVKALLF